MKELKQEGDGTLLSDVGKSIKRGRTTVIEHLFLEGLVMSKAFASEPATLGCSGPL